MSYIPHYPSQGALYFRNQSAKCGHERQAICAAGEPRNTTLFRLLIDTNQAANLEMPLSWSLPADGSWLQDLTTPDVKIMFI